MVEAVLLAKVSAPVANIIINSNKGVFINGKVDQLVPRQKWRNPNRKRCRYRLTFQKRIGVEVIVKDENGNVQEDVIFEDVLDTTELQWNIGLADQHYNYSPTGDRNGSYSNEAKQELNDAMASAQNVLEIESFG